MKYFYGRASTSNQKMSTEIQLQEVEQRFGKVDRIFTDEGVSGAAPMEKRVALIEMISQLRRGDEVYVWSLSRIARETLLNLMIEKEINKAGAKIISVKEELNDTPESILLKQICMAFAEYERQMIRARTKAAKKVYRQQGKFSGGKREYGYKVVEGQLVEVEEEQKVIGMIKEWKSSGSKMAEIQRKLNENNIPSSTGVAWNYYSVRNLVKRVA